MSKFNYNRKILLLFSVFFTLLSSIALVMYSNSNIVPGTPIQSLLLTSCVLWTITVFYKKMSRKIPELVATIILYISSAYVSFKWGPMLPASIYTFVLSALCASMFFKKKGLIIGSLGTMAIVFMSGILSIHGSPNINLEWRSQPFELNDLISHMVMIGIVLFFTYFYLSRLLNTLNKLKISEKDLKQERSSLKSTVELRTSQLIKAHRKELTILNKYAQVGKLSLSAVHDFASPLSSLSLISNNSELDSNYSTSLRHIYQKLKLSHEHLTQSFSPSHTFQSIEIVSFLKNTISLFSYETRLLGITVNLIAPKDIQINVRGSYLSQIFSNLIANSIDELQLIEGDKVIEIIITENIKDVIIEFNDNGKGFSQYVLDSYKTKYTLRSSKDSGHLGVGICTVFHLVTEFCKGAMKLKNGNSVSPTGASTILSLPFNHE